ncbi:hypothetical protein GCM10010329_57080 [Streptomyces spiroverticillatus]|uniref:Uncharacterized protein n=1 Tax=Streptomyces finlayi TaxID=67296 RepID=A0A918X3F3_9ACTN|nr:hypothetical protein [Streptomyces finlayi]GHA26455.1 hypothetical protein GCM10010329_57080 [Streptomyces spiroverticillatus]GHD07959.1 hypothetical protein GCM10010334_60750 [Streptomyces finlayi]
MDPNFRWDEFNRLRSALGYLTPAELIDLADRGTKVLDPFSVILSRYVELGAGNVFYPGAVVECDDESTCAVGGFNVFHGATRIAATGGGNITIGNGTLIGEGGTQIKSSSPATPVTVDDGARLANGAELLGPTWVGAGAQILGPISARSVTLAAGKPHTHPDPDHRGAVLKGFGRADHIRLAPGEVLNATGDFRTAPVERQRAYHPDAPSL